MNAETLQAIFGECGREASRLIAGMNLETLDSAKIAMIRKRVRKIVSRMNAIGGAWTRILAEREYEKAAERTKRILRKIGKTKPTGSESNRSGPEAVATLARTSLLKATASILDTVNEYLAAAKIGSGGIQKLKAIIHEFSFDEYRDELEELADMAIDEEMSVGEFKRLVMERLRRTIGNGKIIVIGKRLFDARKYAEMLSRTMLRDAQTAATLDLCKKYENDLVQVSDHGTQCAVCADFEGQIYSISGNHPVYPMLEYDPPFHPNCLHSILPISEEELDVRGKR